MLEEKTVKASSRPSLVSRILSLPVKAIFSLVSSAEQYWYQHEGVYPRIAALLGFWGPTYTGKTVDTQVALTCSTVWACTRVIAESLSMMPLALMQRTEMGGESARREARNHPLFEILHDEPNPEMDDMGFRETMTGHLVTQGNAYARIARRGSGEVIGLWPIQPGMITRKPNEAGDSGYLIQKNGNQQWMPARDIFHVRGLSPDGITGYSVIENARQGIGLALILEEYGARFFGRGGMPSGMIQKTIPFARNDDRERFREDWKKAYEGSENFHKQLLLEGDWKFEAFGIKPEDAQFLLTRQFSIPEICRWFRVSPHMVADLSRATFSNIEQLAIEFVKYTLSPWAVRWEKAIRRQLLTPEEKAAGYYAKHNLEGLLRGDFAARMAGYATLLQNGVYSINEIRELEDRNPIDGGEDHHIQLNMQSLSGGEPTASQAAALVKVGKPAAMPAASNGTSAGRS